jgi:SAM-dependent methyltransferase
MGWLERIRNRGLPPEHLRLYVGPGGDRWFAKIGKTLVESLEQQGGLTEQDDVLDIGCGSGRVALPLTRLLSRESRYEGFDISAEAIEWCRDNITPKYPNFTFHHADLANTHYNPDGKLNAATFSFPYGNASFDFAFATSLFTHMLPAGIDRYVAEVSRVLRPGGRFLATAFCWNSDVAERAARGEVQVSFPVEHGSYRTASDDLEAVVAYDEQDLLNRLQAGGLHLAGEIHRGSWVSKRESSNPSFQDVIVLRKE